MKELAYNRNMMLPIGYQSINKMLEIRKTSFNLSENGGRKEDRLRDLALVTSNQEVLMLANQVSDSPKRLKKTQNL